MKQFDDQDLIQPDIHSSTQQYRARFSGKVGNWFLQTQNRITHEFLSLCQKAIQPTKDNQPKDTTPTPLSVIDFGGGHAQNIEACLDANTHYTLHGTDERCFHLSKQLYPALTPHYCIHPLMAPLNTEKQTEKHTFDLALSYRMLPHLNDWQAHIHTLCHSSERFVAVEFPSNKSINAFADKLFKLKKSVEGNTRQFQLFDLEQVSSEFAKYGYSLHTARGQYILPMALHRMLNQPAISKLLERMLCCILKRDKIASPLICLYEKKNDN